MNRRKLTLFGKDISEIIWEGVKYILLGIFVFICIYPFYYVIIYSLSDPELAHRGVFLTPIGFTLNNYKSVLQLSGLGNAFLISVTRTVLGTLISVVCTTMLAYLITKDMWGKKFFYRFTILNMYLSGGLIPWYLVMSMYGFTNNFLAYIIPTAISSYNLILVKTFIEQLPPSMEESAAIEGAGFLTTFFKLIVPLSKPIIATIAVYCMVSQWNSWQDNFFLMTRQNMDTVQIILRRFLTIAEQLANSMEDEMGEFTMKITPETIRMTTVVVTMVPVMLVYPFAQKYFTKGIMMGAVKG